MIRISNIKILNKKELHIDLVNKVIWPINLIRTLTNSKMLDIESEFVYNTLLNSNNITFDTLSFDNEKIEITSTKSTLNDYNEITNHIGLTQAEMWFNSLSEEHKIYVKDLSDTVFNSIATAQ